MRDFDVMNGKASFKPEKEKTSEAQKGDGTGDSQPEGGDGEPEGGNGQAQGETGQTVEQN